MNNGELLAAIDLRAALEREIAEITTPIKQLLRESVGERAEELKDLEAIEGVLRGIFSEEYLALYAARRERLLAGEDVPEITTPGLRVQWRDEVKVTDPDAVPREFCVPDLKQIKAAGGCTGAALVKIPVFVRAK